MLPGRVNAIQIDKVYYDKLYNKDISCYGNGFLLLKILGTLVPFKIYV